MTRKILMVLKDLPMGGVEEVFFCLAEEFSKKQVCVDLLILSDRFSSEELCRFETVCRSVKYGGGYFNGFFELFKRCKENSYGAILSAKEKANFTVFLYALCSKLFSAPRPKFLLTRHVSINPAVAASDASFLTKYLYKLYGLLSLCVICCSKGLSDEVFKLSSCRAAFIYNPILGAAFYSKSEERVGGGVLQGRAGSLRCLFVGRLSKQKGVDVLINALRAVNRLCDVFVVGDGDEQDALEFMAREVEGENPLVKIHFVGKRDNPLPAMREADLLIMPSRWEGLPTVLIEALAMGCDIVASDCNYGPREILSREDYGRALFAVEDSEELAKKIECYEVGEKFGRSELAKFSQESCARGYLDVIYGVAS